jgi:molybdate transport system ATP-binding protein
VADQVTIRLSHRFENGPEIEADIDRPTPPGSVLVLFGPSGAGKTTVLRAVAGLVRPDQGRIAVRGTTWFDSSSGRSATPQERRFGYVSQEPALFPHLTVRANVEYGLHRSAKSDRWWRATNAMQRLRVLDLADRRARDLSGGQAQRVALARAVAIEPTLLLLDEPFNALDVAIRRQLRKDVRALVRERGMCAILVTHDRLEAMSMGDDVAVMVDGRVRQTGPIAEVFRRPADPIVAQAVGVETVLPAVVERDDEGLVAVRIGDARLLGVADADTLPGDRVFACIRAEDVVVEPRGASSGSARNRFPGIVKSIDPEGAIDRVTIDCGFPIVALITRRSRDDLSLAEGSQVGAAIKATAVHIVPRE